jgi:hypothetical protein
MRTEGKLELYVELHTYYNSPPRHRSPYSIPYLDPPQDPNM